MNFEQLFCVKITLAMSDLSLVLASNSPRRKQILGWSGIPFSVRPADVDETPLEGESARAYVQRIALSKGRKMSGSAGFKELIVAADTTVAVDDEIIGKPKDAAEARQILLKLRGRVHFVHTAIVVISPSKGLIERELCTTRVRMRRYSEEEIEAYIQSGDPLDKAGAYAIQNESFHPVDQLKGCYASVMGLPLCHLERVLRRMGYGDRKQIPFVCQDELAYNCPIFTRVLNGEDVG